MKHYDWSDDTTKQKWNVFAEMSQVWMQQKLGPGTFFSSAATIFFRDEKNPTTFTSVPDPRFAAESPEN